MGRSSTSSSRKARPASPNTSVTGGAIAWSARSAWVWHAGGDPGKGDARPGELASVADLRRRRPGLGQQVGAKQVGERLGVDPIVLDPGRGDRLGGKGMGHVGGDADI